MKRKLWAIVGLGIVLIAFVLVGYFIYPYSNDYQKFKKESQNKEEKLNALVENYETIGGYCIDLIEGFDKRISLYNEGKQVESDATISDMTVIFGRMQEVATKLPKTSRFYKETLITPSPQPTIKPL